MLPDALLLLGVMAEEGEAGPTEGRFIKKKKEWEGKEKSKKKSKKNLSVLQKTAGCSGRMQLVI
jgi:hypothetical protein